MHEPAPGLFKMIMEIFEIVLLGVGFFIMVYSVWNILGPNSPYNTIKREQSEKKSENTKEENEKFDLNELHAKILEAQERAKEECKRHMEFVEEIRDRRENEKCELLKEHPLPVYKGRKPSIDSFGRAMDGIGVEFKIVGMKYRSIDEQLQAKCLDPGDSVLLIPEINSFTGNEAMAVYTQARVHIGYIVTEQCKKARDMMYREYLQAFVKIPWEMDNSWFIVVVPDQNQ